MSNRDVPPPSANITRYVETNEHQTSYVHYAWENGTGRKEAWERKGMLLEMAGLAPSLNEAKEYIHIAKEENVDSFFRTLKHLRRVDTPVLVWLDRDNEKLRVSNPLRKEPAPQE